MPDSLFQPVRHGFHFSNDKILWKAGPLSGKALCGGMVYAAMDYYMDRLGIPWDTTAPVQGSTLHSYIYDRQLTAHWNTWYRFTSVWLPILGFVGLGAAAASVNEQFDILVSNLAVARPMPICLVTIGKGHHLLAIGCNTQPPFRITVYDPNYPELTCNIFQQADGTFLHPVDNSLWQAFFVDDAYRVKQPPILTGESNWRWCRKCQGLFYGGKPSKGMCPKGGAHDATGSGNYTLALNTGSGETGWMWCPTCMALYWGQGGSAGKCPAGGTHKGSFNFNYSLGLDGGIGQGNWRWCHICQGLFFAGGGSIGVCPANPNGHDGTQGGQYFLPTMAG